MDVKQAYNLWADQYDTNSNKTRDLEAIALRKTLADIPFRQCLEIGCGTGKNTEWLLSKAREVLAVDLSEEMLARAKEKINAAHVRFIQADITHRWTFADKPFDLISFSLVLEHIGDLDAIFKKASEAITPTGIVYIGELHPFKQYTGTKARFDTGDGQQIVTCFDHHMSDFISAAKNNDFDLMDMDEYFDEGDRTSIPRILTLLFRKK